MNLFKFSKKNFMKYVAVTLVALLSYETVATPLAQAAMLAPPLPRNPSSVMSSSQKISGVSVPFRIPTSVGSIVEIHTPSRKGPLVYHLQDVHNNVAAQTNLSQIVSLLEAHAGQQGKNLIVAVEGVSGPVDSDTIAKWPNQKEKEDVGAGLLRAGYMLGEEYAAITHAPGRIQIIGIENPALYAANGAARQDSSAARKSLVSTFKETQAQLSKLMPHNFSAVLTQLENKRLAVEEGTLPLTDYVSFLKGINPQSISRHPNLAKMVALSTQEMGIDFDKVENEGRLLVQEVMASKSEREMDQMMADAQALKEGRLSPLSYYSLLLAQSKRDHPLIRQYVAYLRAAEGIEVEQLFDEVLSAESDIAQGLIRHPIALQLYQHLRWVEQQERFFSLNMIPQEWAQQKKASLRSIVAKHADIRSYVAEQVGDLGYEFQTPSLDATTLITAYKGARGFYEAAEARDSAMIKNLEDIVRTTDPEKSLIAFVTGGFHTPGMTQQLRSAGFAYEVIRPQLETEVELSEGIKYPARIVSYLRQGGGLPALTNEVQKGASLSDAAKKSPTEEILYQGTNPNNPKDITWFAGAAVSLVVLGVISIISWIALVVGRYYSKEKPRGELIDLNQESPYFFDSNNVFSRLTKQGQLDPLKLKGAREFAAALGLDPQFTFSQTLSITNETLIIPAKYISSFSNESLRGGPLLGESWDKFFVRTFLDEGRPLTESVFQQFAGKVPVEFSDPKDHSIPPSWQVRIAQKSEAKVKEMLAKAAELSNVALSDLNEESIRANAFRKYNTHVGGLAQVIAGRTMDQVAPEDLSIPEEYSRQDAIDFLERVASGELGWMLTAGGKATRMAMPSEFDRLGIAGMTPAILKRLVALGYEDIKKIPKGSDFADLIHRASQGVIESSDDLSIIQRELLQLQEEIVALHREYPSGNFTSNQLLGQVTFIATVNSINIEAIKNQLAVLNFPGKILLIEQPEIGVVSNPDALGHTHWVGDDLNPEGHYVPLLSMVRQIEGGYVLDKEGSLQPLSTTIQEEIKGSGVEYLMFAQSHDLHLMEGMASVSRWKTGLDQMAEFGDEMIMEMVSNTQKINGGGAFKKPEGDNIVVRDTIAMEGDEFKPFSIPTSLSRMLYILNVEALGRLNEGSVPTYLKQRTKGIGLERLSGDASSELATRTMRKTGEEIITFKNRSGLRMTLSTMGRQNKALARFYKERNESEVPGVLETVVNKGSRGFIDSTLLIAMATLSGGLFLGTAGFSNFDVVSVITKLVIAGGAIAAIWLMALFGKRVIKKNQGVDSKSSILSRVISSITAAAGDRYAQFIIGASSIEKREEALQGRDRQQQGQAREVINLVIQLSQLSLSGDLTTAINQMVGTLEKQANHLNSNALKEVQLIVVDDIGLDSSVPNALAKLNGKFGIQSRFIANDNIPAKAKTANELDLKILLSELSVPNVVFGQSEKPGNVVLFGTGERTIEGVQYISVSNFLYLALAIYAHAKFADPKHALDELVGLIQSIMNINILGEISDKLDIEKLAAIMA